jgi:N-acetyl-gamma-glutamyl-phosphate reductase
VGATGYSGLELIRLLLQHPQVTIHKLYASAQEYASVTEVYPHLNTFTNLAIEQIGDVSDAELADMRANAEVVFLATPSGVSTELGPRLLKAGFKIIDLSGDFRIKDRDVYEEWYQLIAPTAENLDKAVYGLSEWFPATIKKANYIANPGCYATGILLGIAPIVAAGLDVKSIIADAKSGVSGAGRGVSRGVHFSEVNENFKAYRVGAHKHIPEIEGVVETLANKKLLIDMVPHLVPMTRGILSTIYIELGAGGENPGRVAIDEKTIREIYTQAYAEQPFIRLLAAGKLPETKQVSGTNFCDIGLHLDKRTGRIIVITAIDNLMKGASGQAVQNLNLMMGWEQDLGLKIIPMYP